MSYVRIILRPFRSMTGVLSSTSSSTESSLVQAASTGDFPLSARDACCTSSREVPFRKETL
ncbi:hypothetical protein Scep_008294 [Stephania cephalantha]|uniref:Uncharacterized protein n=1 Tax=Stephania cephalantha TaxID=152367 RepID=A0AAP0KE28_9MAGN